MYNNVKIIEKAGLPYRKSPLDTKTQKVHIDIKIIKSLISLSTDHREN